MEKKKTQPNLNPVGVFSKTTTTLLRIGAIYLKPKETAASERHCIELLPCIVSHTCSTPHHSCDKVPRATMQLSGISNYSIIYFKFFISKRFNLISSFSKSVKLTHFLPIIIIVIIFEN